MFSNVGMGEILLGLSIVLLVYVGLPVGMIVLAMRWWRRSRAHPDARALADRLRAAEERVADLALANAELEEQRRFAEALLSQRGAPPPGARSPVP